MEPDQIIIRGARQHNLKNIDINIPRNRFVVLTGVSGSGKSSLAFDTLYAEGQRRYVESLSSYARQFLGQMEKPQVDFIGGLSPAIAIEQKSVSRNPRSTVGTVTDVMDYLRVLFARTGQPHCPKCGRTVQSQSAQQIARQIAQLAPGTRLQLLAPVVRNRKGTHEQTIQDLIKAGFTRARIDGVTVEFFSDIKLAKTKKHNLDVIVDRLIIPDIPSDTDDESQTNDLQADTTAFLERLIDSVETTLRTSAGLLIAAVHDGDEIMLSEHNACPHCNLSFPELSPQLFSFNSPIGMCPRCHGLGTTMDVDPDLIIQDKSLSLLDGASRWYGVLRKKKKSWTYNQLSRIAEHYNADLETPWLELPENFRQALIHGSGNEKIHFIYHHEGDETTWTGESTRPLKGIMHTINRRFRQTKSEHTKRFYTSFMNQLPCPACNGARLRPEALAVTVGEHTLAQVSQFTIAEAYRWVTALGYHAFGVNTISNGNSLHKNPQWLTELLTNLPGDITPLNEDELEIGAEILKEIRDRLRFMLDVGLHYLSLDRPAGTLSGGEGQRIRLASQIGCGLVGVLYILDEPSIGLHARDNHALLETLLQLRDMGNTVLVVEHDAETMLAADWLIDLGPGAGILGGEIVSAGTPAQVSTDPDSLTGQYLSGTVEVAGPNGKKRREPEQGSLIIKGARHNNLKNIDVTFPVGLMTCVTGVSGSGKSSLIAETLYPALARQLHKSQKRPGSYDRIEGVEHFDKVINITQSPIGRTPRSNPATYVQLFTLIRDVFAKTAAARSHGYAAGRFSFNVKGGRCEPCKGHGQKKIEMHFLSDVWVRCQECQGQRYNRETLSILFKGKNIAEILNMDVYEALSFFENHTKIARILQTLHAVGLDYVKLGQSAVTLSGGEAQRVKLAKELGRAATGRTLYILDEPTTGLHFADIQRLLDVLHRLVNTGNTVVIIEHNLDVIKTADWIIDLGPEGGYNGGYIVAQGSPESIRSESASYTAEFLRDVL